MDDVLSSTDFIQASRVLKVSSPLGEDQLLPESMMVDEGVNHLFEITLSVRAKREAVKPEELIGNQKSSLLNYQLFVSRALMTDKADDEEALSCRGGAKRPNRHQAEDERSHSY
ncbi:hypothetical protein G6L01_014650 [Agrobacterium vitis]|nr:hypothetical protein G6L01_014650 [Agrobacterium vitis]